MSCSLRSALTRLSSIAVCSIGILGLGLADPAPHRLVEGPNALGADAVLQPSVACGSATVISLDTPVAGDTTAATNNYEAAAACFAAGVGQFVTTAPGPDTVFQFTVPADAPVGGKYSFRATKSDALGDLAVYVGECPSPGAPPQVITCAPVGGGANRGSGNRAEEAMCLTLAPGQTVYVYVDDAVAATHTFTMEVNRCTTETESNILPASANPLVCGLEGSSAPAADVDYFSLGTFVNGERVFAMADGAAAIPTGAFDMRITNTTNTLEYDAADNDADFGQASPNIAGRELPNQATYIRLNGNTTEPYRLYSVVQPALGGAVDESEPNGTVATADADPINYFKGSLSRTVDSADTDFFRFCAQAGDLIFLSLDADPLRNLTPINPSLQLRFGSTILLTVSDNDATSTATPGGADALNKTDPTSPAEALTWRARATGSGFYNARVTWPVGADLTEDYLLSVSINCQNAVQRATDLGVMKSFDDPSVAVGESTSYTVTLTNHGPNRADFVDLRDPIPPGTIFLGKTADPAGWTCTTPALGTTGEIACTSDLFPAGAELTYTVSVKVLDPCLDMTSAATSVSSCTLDPVAFNNSDTATITVTGSCSDDDPCTDGDDCSGDTCVGELVSCEDDNSCTADSCESASGCVNLTTAGACDDGNDCTDDACSTLDSCGPATSDTFTNTLDPARPIEDTRTVTSTITVADVGSYLWDVNLETFIAHTANGDLEVTLKSPAGTIVTITSDNGAMDDNVFNGTEWDDSADPLHEAPFATDTFTASNLVTDTRFNDVPKITLVPEEAMAAFIGENPNGTWTLTISDDSDNDQEGALSSWSLIVATLPAAPIETTAVVTNNTSTPIPADAATTITSTINAGGLGTQLGKLRLTTHIQHSNVSDLDITLKSPSGTIATIVTDRSGAQDNVFDGTVWDDDADPGNDAPFPSSTATFAASNVVTDTTLANSQTETTLVIEEALGLFHGIDPNGVWTLKVSDDEGLVGGLGDGGTLVSWSLELTTVTCGGSCVGVNDNTNTCDGQACTTGGNCSAGACIGGTPIDCSAFANDCNSGVCNLTTGGCEAQPTNEDGVCNDGLPGTKTGTCSGGVCVGQAVDCTEPGNDGEPCDDGIACTELGTCSGATCLQGVPTDCSHLDTDCSIGRCNVPTDSCLSQPANDEKECNLDSPCGSSGICEAGTCSGIEPTCPDPDPDDCTVVVCNEANGDCGSQQAPDGTSCNDHSSCTSGDVCSTGACVGTPVVCPSDGNDCTDETCNPGTGVCSSVADNSNICSDGNLCTNDSCVGGTCVGSAVTCPSDGNDCTDDVCDPGTGACSSVVDDTNTCSDSLACTTGDACVSGTCVGSPVVCPGDGNDCTDETCNPGTGACSSAPDNTNTCSDGLLCTNGDACVGGACVGSPVVCRSDGNDCTDETCNPGTGACSSAPDNTNTCSDSLACTTGDACVSGTCVGSPVVCPGDGNDCTDETCNPGTGACSSAPDNTNTCSDGLLCTNGDTCVGGACVGSAVVCPSDGNDCTDETCNPGTGACSSAPDNANTCSDGLLCTNGDACVGGACVGSPVVCPSDGNDCTDETCNPDTGACSSAPDNANTCSDGLLCTNGDACVGGTCVGSPVVCPSDGNDCTDETCNPDTGACSSAPDNTNTCSDGLLCTNGDACVGGACVGSPVVCPSDGNDCTDETCNPGTGICSSALDETNTCDDGEFCTTGDTCSGGTCGGSPRDCSGLTNECNVGVCNETAKACEAQPTNLGGACADDGVFCTTPAFCDSRGMCVGGGAPTDCSYLDTDCSIGRCNLALDKCLSQPENNGKSCNLDQLCATEGTCDAGACIGSEPTCPDADPSDCTVSVCDDATGECGTQPVQEGTACDDGDASTCNDVCSAGMCAGSTRPDEVCDGALASCEQPLLLSKTSTAAKLEWSDDNAGPFNVYRGVWRPGHPSFYTQYCWEHGLSQPSTEDDEIPQPRTFFYYFVARQPGGDGECESILGRDSDGVAVTSDDLPCPEPPPDSDHDGVLDYQDTCPLDERPEKNDTDGDLHGDICDNCPGADNSFQEDLDDDGVGDACDPDIDGDLVDNASDNCPLVFNDQADRDTDGVGDACDNCPACSNPSQKDANRNGKGDACENGDCRPGPVPRIAP